MRFKQRLKVIQSLEDTAKRSVVWSLAKATGTSGSKDLLPVPAPALSLHCLGTRVTAQMLCGPKAPQHGCWFGELGGGPGHLVEFVSCTLHTQTPSLLG